MTRASDENASIEQRIYDAAAKTPYSYEAFLFVLQGMPKSYSPHFPDNHVDAAEVCWRLRDRAIATFGSAARERLADWSVRSCDDFGNIVYALVDSGLVGKTEQDSRADFSGVFDFDEAFRIGAKPRGANTRIQWRLSTMFVLTTVAAIACAGFARLGVSGAAATVFSSWIGLIGLYCVVQGVTDRSKGWMLSIGVGVVLTAVAIAVFLGVTLATD